MDKYYWQFNILDKSHKLIYDKVALITTQGKDGFLLCLANPSHIMFSYFSSSSAKKSQGTISYKQEMSLIADISFLLCLMKWEEKRKKERKRKRTYIFNPYEYKYERHRLNVLRMGLPLWTLIIRLDKCHMIKDWICHWIHTLWCKDQMLLYEWLCSAFSNYLVMPLSYC